MALHLLNTTIIPAGADGVYVVTTITLEKAREILRLEHSVESHIGHQSTADMMSALFGISVPMDRSPWDGTGMGLVTGLGFRGEEGRVYGAEEMAAFAAEGKVIFRLIQRVRL